MSKKRLNSDSESEESNVSLDDDDQLLNSSDDETLSSNSGESYMSDNLAADDLESDEEEGDDVPLINWKQVKANTPIDFGRFPFTAKPGITVPVDRNWTQLDYLKLFLDADVMHLIVTETNRYAEQYLLKKFPNESKRRKYGWTPVTVDEVWVYTAVLIYQAIIKKPKLRWYWTRNKLLETPFVKEIMSRIRFERINKFLHFANNETFDAATHTCTKLRKIWELYQAINNKFEMIYIPERDISLDESLMAFKGRISWKQYIPSKRARFGLKFFMICESSSGYIIKTILYTGKDTVKDKSTDDQSVTTSIVLKLCENLLRKGYCLIMDNFYNSVELYNILLANKTDAYGTIKSNRKGLPENFSKLKLKKDEAACWMKEGMVAIKWHDKKDICLISTCHDVSFQDVVPKFGPKKLKPSIVIDYNKAMGGVDTADQSMTSYTLMRSQQRKCYKKIFQHLLDQCLLNAYILYSKYKDKGSEHLAFLIQIIHQIMKIHEKGTQPSVKKTGRPRIELLMGDSNPIRLTARHFPKVVPQTDQKKKPVKRCVVCSSSKNKKSVRKESRYYCKECDVGLCVSPCFEIFHTKEDF